MLRCAGMPKLASHVSRNAGKEPDSWRFMNTALPACPLLAASFIFVDSSAIAFSHVVSVSTPFSRTLGFL